MRHVLIGMRGSGKTTLGRAAASSLGAHFIDLDDMARESFGGQSVADIWRRHGESAWRAAEAEAFDRWLNSTEAELVAIGGGAPLIPAVRDALNEARSADRCRVIYLQCGEAELARRVRSGGVVRPSLTGKPVDEEIGPILAQRRGVYESLADYTVDTTRGTVDQCAAALVDVIRSSSSGRRGACCS